MNTEKLPDKLPYFPELNYDNPYTSFKLIDNLGTEVSKLREVIEFTEEEVLVLKTILLKIAEGQVANMRRDLGVAEG